jgi:hypothetical protein
VVCFHVEAAHYINSNTYWIKSEHGSKCGSKPTPDTRHYGERRCR